MNNIAIGIVGLGYWGKNYLRTLREYDCCQLFGTDVDEKIRKDFQNLQLLSFSELLANSAIQALVIATPDDTHFQLTAQALGAGKDVLVEKPMALSLPDAEEILNIALSQKRVVAVGHTPIYSDGFRLLKLQMKKIPLKDIIRVEAVRTSHGRKNNSDILWDLASHDLAILIQLFGLPKSGKIVKRGWGSCCYQMFFANDIEFTGTVSWSGPPFHRELKVYTKSGVHHFQEPIGVGGQNSDLPLKRLCADFIRCCYTREKPLSDAVLGFNVVKCLAALSAQNASIRLPKPVDVM